MKIDINDTSFLKQIPCSTHPNASIAFLENIELQLLDQLRDAELVWENRQMAKKLLRGPLKSVAVRRDLERIAGLLPDKSNQGQK